MSGDIADQSWSWPVAIEAATETEADSGTVIGYAVRQFPGLPDLFDQFCCYNY